MGKIKDEESEVREEPIESQKARNRKSAGYWPRRESRELGCKSDSGRVRPAVSGDPSKPERKALSGGCHF